MYVDTGAFEASLVESGIPGGELGRVELVTLLMIAYAGYPQVTQECS